MGNVANFRTRAHIVKVAGHMLPGPDNGVGGGGGVHSPDLHSLDAAAAANTPLGCCIYNAAAAATTERMQHDACSLRGEQRSNLVRHVKAKTNT